MWRAFRAIKGDGAGNHWCACGLGSTHHAQSILQRALNQRGAAHGEFRIGEAALKIHHDHAGLFAKPNRPVPIAARGIDIFHHRAPFIIGDKYLPKVPM